jgi:hypothetical protein
MMVPLMLPILMSVPGMIADKFNMDSKCFSWCTVLCGHGVLVLTQTWAFTRIRDL